MSTFMRPNTALVERKVSSTKSLTGEPITAPTTIHAALPCRIDPLPVASRMAGDLRFTVEGVVYIQTHVLFADGLMPSRFPNGATPGQQFVLNGITYTIAANGRGAFPSLQANDRVTDEKGRTYLVLAESEYSDAMPNTQARLQAGRAWA